jgi:3-methylcrotonyl-CoA carboxylase alpha subunit
VAIVKISAKAGQQLVELVIERRDGSYMVQYGGEKHLVDVHKLEGDFYSILTGGRSYEVSVEPRGETYYVRHGASELLVALSDPSRQAREGRIKKGPEEIVTQMPGKVVRLLIEEGATVEEGQGILVVEAMKMENEIAATKPGKVVSLKVEPGQTVEGGAVLAVIE